MSDTSSALLRSRTPAQFQHDLIRCQGGQLKKIRVVSLELLRQNEFLTKLHAFKGIMDPHLVQGIDIIIQHESTLRDQS